MEGNKWQTKEGNEEVALKWFEGCLSGQTFSCRQACGLATIYLEDDVTCLHLQKRSMCFDVHEGALFE